MKKFLALTIVFSVAFIMSNVSVAKETTEATKFSATEISVPAEQGVVETSVGEEIQAGYVPVPHHHPCQFVRRACTPCVANPCNPCPPCVTPPVCAPIPRKRCGAPIQAAPFVGPYADPCGYGYAGHQPAPRRSCLSRLFSKLNDHNSYGYHGYPYGYGYGYHGYPEFGYGAEYPHPSPCSCEHNHD